MSNLDSNALEAACASVDYPADVWQRKLLVEKAITAYQAALPSDGLAGRLLDEMSAEIAALMTAIACSDPYSELKVRGFDLAKKFTALKQAIAAAALLAREGWQPETVATYEKEWKSAEAVVGEVTAERRRQVMSEGWSQSHDDQHTAGELSRASACYAAHASAFTRVQYDVSPEIYRASEPPPFVGWPWGKEWWKPKNPRRDLVRAAALIIAEIERLDRLPAAPIPATGKESKNG